MEDGQAGDRAGHVPPGTGTGGGRRHMSDTEYIQVTHRELPYPTFDADNHMYENRDALTKFLPPEYEGLIKYVEVEGRTKLAIRDKISDYIPNPTFVKVA